LVRTRGCRIGGGGGRWLHPIVYGAREDYGKKACCAGPADGEGGLDVAEQIARCEQRRVAGELVDVTKNVPSTLQREDREG